MEQKYQIGTDIGFIMWNITAILQEVDKLPIRIYNVKQLVDKNPFHVNREYAVKTDLSQPLVKVQLCNGKEKLIDGNHRLYKAYHLGEKTISSYFEKKDHQKYIIDFDENLYDRVVDDF